MYFAFILSYRFLNNFLDSLEIRAVGVGHRLVVGDVDDLQGEPRAAVGSLVVLRVTFALVLLDHVQLVERPASSLGSTGEVRALQCLSPPRRTLPCRALQQIVD